MASRVCSFCVGTSSLHSDPRSNTNACQELFGRTNSEHSGDTFITIYDPWLGLHPIDIIPNIKPLGYELQKRPTCFCWAIPAESFTLGLAVLAAFTKQSYNKQICNEFILLEHSHDPKVWRESGVSRILLNDDSSATSYTSSIPIAPL